MKKISVIALFSCLMFTAWAVDEGLTDLQLDNGVIIPNVATKFNPDPVSNPAIRFPHGLQMGLGVSPTSGLNLFVGYNNKNFDSFWAKRFGVRLDFATYAPIKSKLNKEINDTVSSDGFEIGDELKINNFALSAKHIGALVDFYPFGDTWFLGGLRLSGGYVFGNLKLDADIFAKNNGGKIEFELDGEKYYYDGNQMKGKAKANWKYSGPYLGTGFDLGLFAGFKMYFDAGVVFTDKTTDLDLNVPLTNDLKDALGQAVKGDVDLEQKFEDAKNATLKDARKELDDMKYFPLVKIGFMYRF